MNKQVISTFVKKYTMRLVPYISVAVILTLISSCRNDFDFEPSTVHLEFSRDTVYLDTVFSNIGSSTYTLKVYNRSNKDIKIPRIGLGGGENSKYRLMVDGMYGKIFNNVEMLARDSMYIFIETTIDYNDYANSETTFLYTDKIEFESVTHTQKVELVTLVQDAIFLYPHRDENGVYEELEIGPDKIRGFFLDENDPNHGNELIWTNEKPYVIYGYAAVPSGKTLEVQEGARIHFHDNSGIIVANNASIQVNGTLENPVMFEGDRLEPFFSEIPGQWGTIWLTSGSVDNSVKNAIIKNSIIGLLVQNCPLELENVQIYNTANFGIMAQTGYINGFNVVINNAGQSSLACTVGGNYSFVHSTIANYWNRSYRSLPALILDNTYETVEGFLPLNAQFENCIVYGSNNIELNINKAEGSIFNFSFENSLIRFVDLNNRFTENPIYDFDNTSLYLNSVIAKTLNGNKADFVNGIKNDLRILDSSAAKGIATPNYSGTGDILGNLRSGEIDAGAYNFVVIESE